MAELTDGTGSGCLLFLERVAERGQMNPSTARSYAAAVRAVLSIEDGEVNLRTADLDDLLDRFQTLRRADYADDSMATYKSRFRQSVLMYLAYLDNDPSWKTVGRAARAPRSATPSQRLPTKKPSRRTAVAPHSESAASAEESEGGLRQIRLVSYNLPLRADLIVQLQLPADLTSGDAERIAGFVRSLAFTDQPIQGPQISSGGI